ncbi:MAG: hypothetical protein MUF10_02445 [Thermoanaerobaculaceae bacterium]|jgi:hypothetical protein|nr:hypothetical protein [Thermoanaerobaculaceae bacterium]
MKDRELDGSQVSVTVLEGETGTPQKPAELDGPPVWLANRHALTGRLGAGAAAEVFAALDPEHVLLGFTVERPDPTVRRLAREHSGRAVDRLLAPGQAPRAHALVALLPADAGKHNLLGLDRSDVARLEATLRTIESQPPPTPRPLDAPTEAR